jgi:CcmD family protein
MDSPANTLNYMIAGYSVIFVVTISYLVSLAVRFKRLRREERKLETDRPEKK